MSKPCGISGCGLQVREDGDCALHCRATRDARRVARDNDKAIKRRAIEARKPPGMRQLSEMMTERLVEKSPVEAHTHAKQVRRARRGHKTMPRLNASTEPSRGKDRTARIGGAPPVPTLKCLPLPEIGKQVWNWTVLREVSRREYDRRVICRCKCGKERAVFVSHLRSGNSKGCQSCARSHSAFSRFLNQLDEVLGEEA